MPRSPDSHQGINDVSQETSWETRHRSGSCSQHSCPSMVTHVALSEADWVWKAPSWSCLGGYVAKAGLKLLTLLPLPSRMGIISQDSDEAYK